MSRWLKRDDWPFGSAPWPVAKLPVILEWMIEWLQEDRSRDDAPMHPDEIAELAEYERKVKADVQAALSRRANAT